MFHFVWNHKRFLFFNGHEYFTHGGIGVADVRKSSMNLAIMLISDGGAPPILRSLGGLIDLSPAPDLTSRRYFRADGTHHAGRPGPDRGLRL